MPTRIILLNPKYPHNIGAAIRAASCFGIDQVIWSGTRAKKEIEAAKRIPREERMRGYKEVEILWKEKPLEGIPANEITCVELVKDAVSIFDYHPYRVTTTYVFGPEDGSVPPEIRRLCGHFMYIPSYHCLNLSAAVYVTLFDRIQWEYIKENIEPPSLKETRGDIQFLSED